MLEYHLATAHWMASHQAFIHAPSTLILIFFNRSLFLSGFKNFHAYAYPFSNRICPSTRIWIHSSTQDSSGNIGKQSMRRKVVKTWERGCHLEYSSDGKELGCILLRHRKKNKQTNKQTKKKQPDLASTRFRIHSVFKNFHSRERNIVTL